MTKKIIDYSKTVIYKIVCNDLNVKDLYVGSTTNFRKRKTNHKCHCNNVNSKKYNYQVYQFIRNNGGWTNWMMILVENYPCETSLEKLKRERFWYETLGATLNKQVPNRSDIEYTYQYYHAKKCYINQKYNCHCGGCFTNANKQQHNKTIKHQKYLQIEKFKAGIIKCQSLEELKIFMQQ
jgi:hypothetical protein